MSPRLLIVEARFYDDVADALLEGAGAAIAEAGGHYHTVTVGGALEIPAAISFALRAMAQGKGDHYDGFVALGCVIRGETYHFEVVSNESARGLMDLSVREGIALGNGILTVETHAQAIERAKADRLDKGGGAARAALDMIALRDSLGERS